jgi:hypothetical protein
MLDELCLLGRFTWRREHWSVQRQGDAFQLPKVSLTCCSMKMRCKNIRVLECLCFYNTWMCWLRVGAFKASSPVHQFWPQFTKQQLQLEWVLVAHQWKVNLQSGMINAFGFGGCFQVSPVIHLVYHIQCHQFGCNFHLL